MAESVSGITLSLQMKATIKNAINTDQFPSFLNSLSFTPATALSNGTGANQFDRCWYAEDRVLNSGTSENLDLYDLASFDIGAGAGKDALGLAMTNAELVGMAIVNSVDSAGDLYVGGEGSGASFQSVFHVSGTASDTAGFGPIKPGGFMSFFSPGNPAYVIADSTNHLLKFAAPSGNVTYSCIFFARSA